jgi:hypothetical protein
MFDFLSDGSKQAFLSFLISYDIEGASDKLQELSREKGWI